MLELNEVRKIYNQNNDIVQNFQGLQIGRQTTVLELEAKFGFYSGKWFNSTVPYIHYERLLKILREPRRGYIETNQESSVSQEADENIRRITITPQGNDPERVLWQRKSNLGDFEFPDYDIRISANKEEDLSPDQIPREFRPTTIRERTRHSFILVENLIRVDMTEVMMRGKDNTVRPRYEVEVEFLGHQEDLPIFNEYIEKVFKWLRGTNLIYTNAVKTQLNQEIHAILGGKTPGLIDKELLVEARNIKRRDLIYGGIVGNNHLINEKVLSTNKRPVTRGAGGTNYMITFKADGTRKMLIIHSTGIWLVYPPFEFNLVLDLSLKLPQLDKLLTGYNGTVLDGELVTAKPDRTVNIAYWYKAFDCLAFRGNAGIQAQSYLERQKIVNALAGPMRTEILTIDTKRTEEIKSPTDFFRLVREFLDGRDDLNYNEDGIMFIPIDVIYNPYSQDYDLKDRSLARIPDICKWKEGIDITIDFAIKWVKLEGSEGVENGHLDLYSYDHIKNEMVPFRGDLINPFTPDMVDHTDPLTLGEPTNTVMEYEWIRLPGGKGIFRPRRIRPEKMGSPNRLSIALDDWDDIMNPITQDDILGDTLTMTFSYHNRVKKGLYGIIPRGSNILDIGSGRGGDVAKWIGLADKGKGGLIVAVEPNAEHRNNLMTRINTFNMQNRVRIVPTGGEDTVAITNAVREFIPGGKVDVVTIMLSLSFFWASDSHLDALVQTIVTNLKPGGMIVFLTVDGTTVEQIFEPALNGPHITDKTIATATLHLYPNPPLGFGRAIDFILPDTIVGEQREFLVHLNDLSLRLEPYGIILAELHRAEGEKLLSESNMLFSSMYSYGYYVNDDKIALQQYDQTARTLANIILPIIPQPTKYLLAKMDTPTITITATAISPRSPLKTPINSPPKVVIPAVITTPRIMVPQIIAPPKTSTIPTIPIIQGLQPINPRTPPIIPQITGLNIIPVIPKLTTFQIDRDQLPGLAVNFTGRGGRIVTGPAYNDDTYAPLTCTWYENLVRIATIGEGSCFIHAVLKGFYRAYQENNLALSRLNTAAKIRRDLAITLGMEDPQYPGHTYWETSARGAFPRMVMQQINDEDLVRQLGLDYSLAGIQRLLNSTSWLGDEVYSFISNALNIDIYILRATRSNLFPHVHTRRPEINRGGIVVIGNTHHYEVLAVNTDAGFQTVFYPGDPFLDALINLFIGDGGFNDIVNTVAFDPDENFINSVIDVFVGPQGLVIPAVVAEIFPENDPVRLALARLMPRIQEAAQMRVDELYTGLVEENPVLAHLDTIIKYLQQGGFTIERTNQLRDLVVEGLNLNPNQDLDTILANAETDGRIDHDIAEAVTTIEATL